jgi:hypothetical protein
VYGFSVLGCALGPAHHLSGGPFLCLPYCPLSEPQSANGTVGTPATLQQGHGGGGHVQTPVLILSTT